jgi:hypothetical protein
MRMVQANGCPPSATFYDGDRRGSLGLGTSTTSTGFEFGGAGPRSCFGFLRLVFIGDLQLVPLVFAPATGSDLRSRGAVCHPFLAPVSCKARGLIVTVDLPQRVPGQRCRIHARDVAFNIKGNDYGLARVRMVAIVPIFIHRGARTVTIERDFAESDGAADDRC